MRRFAAARARLCFWLAMVPAFVFLMAGLSRFGAEKGLWLYAIFVLWTMTFFVLINRQAFALSRQAMTQLEQDCDPAPLLELSRDILRQNPKSLHFQVHKGYALALMGREEEARAAAELAAGQSRLWKTPGLLLLWSACLSPDDPRHETVAQVLTRQGKALPPALRAQLEEYLAYRQALTRYQHLPPELLDYLQRRLADAATPKERVGAHLTLGTFLAVQGNGEAEAHLNYVLTHAKGLQGARLQAERLLCLLPLAPQQPQRL